MPVFVSLKVWEGFWISLFGISYDVFCRLLTMDLLIAGYGSQPAKTSK